MVIDAHQHFWDPARADYPWMDAPELAPIRRAFGPADLAPLLRANGIDASIVVQCRSSVEETEEFLRTAAATPFVIGVVGWVDLTDIAVDETLARLRGLPGGDRLVGIRHQVHDESDPDWLLREDVQRGLAAVFAQGLSYDLLVRTRELPAAIATAQAFPQARFVLDHAAKPPIADGFSREWADLLAALAASGNVWCKVSGLATEAGWDDWDAERLFPFVAHAAECFGEDRLIFGSDWPVCLLAGSYGATKDALDACLTKLGPELRDKAFGANAERAYLFP
jgi:L-fuconolactonase